MSHRPLAIVSGLTIGDYLLWNWSLNHHRDVLALISGLTLPPLTIVFLWLLAVTLARIVANTTRRSRERSAGRAGSAHARRRPADGSPAPGTLEQSPASPSPAPASSTAASRKLAA